jgi:mono/diheme cytochrome c family protein
VSGAFRAFYEVGDFSNLVDTPYGAVLLGKLILLVPILGVAAFNLLVVERIKQTANPVQAIGRTVRIEILFAVLILGMTGILTSLPPAREAFGAGQVVRGTVDDLRILVAINPGLPGLNTFDIYAKDSLNRPIPEARKVALNIDMTGHPMGIQEAVAEQVEPGHYAVSGGYTSMIGLWEIEVIVRRDGRDDARLKLNLPLLSLTRPQPGLTIVSPSNLLVGLELLAAGVLLLLAAPRLDAARRGTGMLARLLAGVIVVLCLFAFLNALNAGENGALALRNPIPADAASLGRGQKIYQTNCVACHGATGAGDGPVAASLNPKPANLQIHMNDGHPDGLLYNWITNGVNGSAMPAFATTLTEPERWDVLNYIRSLARPR